MTEVEIYSVKNKLLCKLPVESATTVQEVKCAIERKVSNLKVCRQSLRDDPKGKDLKDSLVVSSILKNGQRLYVKDLGPQISWTTVFVAEYFGPLVVYALFALRPQIIYGKSEEDMSTAAFTAWICWTIHYSKRLFETIFIHRFSHGTMPIHNLFKNCSYYWGFAAYVAYHVNHPLFMEPPLLQVILGAVLFFFAEAGNLSIHILLRNLRPVGTTVRKIPVPNSIPFTILFNYVSCPNYLYEYGAWIGFSIMTSCVPALLFAIAGMYQMTIWALGKHKNYKKEFSDYPRKRKAIVPFII